MDKWTELEALSRELQRDSRRYPEQKEGAAE